MNTLTPWHSLEAIRGLVALESIWQRKLGDSFPAFRNLCLQPSSWQVRGFPCPRGCGCNHLVIPRHDGAGVVAVCCCEPAACPDLSLTLEQVTPLEVSRARLGLALCQAFGFLRRQADILCPNTFQFGVWSTDAVPVILTVQVQNSDFRRAVAELAAQLRQRFILFAPTSDFLDVPSKTILQNLGAAFFALDSHAILTDHGTVQSRRAPGELFAQFTPQPADADENVARRAFALVRNLDTDKPMRPPTLLTVFRHYCIEELSVARIARKYECSKPTILRRLDLIHARTGADPRELRRLSPHIAKLEDALTDPRASHIHRTQDSREEEL